MVKRVSKTEHGRLAVGGSRAGILEIQLKYYKTQKSDKMIKNHAQTKTMKRGFLSELQVHKIRYTTLIQISIN